MAYRWRKRNRWLCEVAFNALLCEPEWSAERRRIVVHEVCHIKYKHPGHSLVIWRDSSGLDGFGRYLEDYWEQQAEYMAAYVLVPRKTLLAMPDESSDYVAGVVDVPPHLVTLRWSLWSKFGQ